MKKLRVSAFIAATALLTVAAPAFAQDVNNPTGSLLDRPQGPPSEPAIMAPGAPATGQPPSADPNAPLEGRATSTPSAARPPKTDRGAPANPSVRKRASEINPSTGSDAGGR